MVWEAFLFGRACEWLGVDAPETPPEMGVDRDMARNPSYSLLLVVEGDASRGDDSNGVWGVLYKGDIAPAGGNDDKTGTVFNHGPIDCVLLKFVYSVYVGHSILGTDCGKSMAGYSAGYGTSPNRKGRSARASVLSNEEYKNSSGKKNWSKGICWLPKTFDC